MNKSKIKILSIGLSVIILCSVGTAVYAKTSETSNISEESVVSTSVENKDSNTMTNTDEENIYIISNPDGQVKKIISDTNNNEETLPISIEIKYSLDGKNISPKELTGKSGHIVIRYEYKNNIGRTVKIKNKKEELNVPFAAVTGIILDEELFTNVTVKNSKVLDDGNRYTIVGLTLPSLQDNLKISKNDIDIPEYIEISADVVDFKLPSTFVFVTNEIFNAIDISKIDDIDDLFKSMNDLQKASNDLVDGSNKLYNGISTLLDKSSELSNGIEKLSEGSIALKNGAYELDNGAVQLKNGANQLYAGLSALSEHNTELNSAAKQVFDTLLLQATNKLNENGLAIEPLTTDNYSTILQNIIAQFDENAIYEKVLSQVTQSVESKRNEISAAVYENVKNVISDKVKATVENNIYEKVTFEVRETVASQIIPVVSNGTLTKEDYDELVQSGNIDEETKNLIESTINEQMLTDDIKSKIKIIVDTEMAKDETLHIIEENINEQMTSQSVKDLITENTNSKIEQIIADTMASDEIQNKFVEASQVTKSLIELKTSLDSYNAFYNGLVNYTAGVSKALEGADGLKQGSEKLSEGSTKLNSGTQELSDGISKMKDNTPALISGITELKDGSKKLSDGMNEFNEKGIKKLTSELNGNLDDIIERFKNTIKLSKQYTNNFNSINYIYKIDSYED